MTACQTFRKEDSEFSFGFVGVVGAIRCHSAEFKATFENISNYEPKQSERKRCSDVRRGTKWSREAEGVG